MSLPNVDPVVALGRQYELSRQLSEHFGEINESADDRRREEAASARANGIEDAIIAMPAQSLTGALVQSRILSYYIDQAAENADGEIPDATVRGMVDNDLTTAKRLSSSILNALEHLLGIDRRAFAGYSYVRPQDDHWFCPLPVLPALPQGYSHFPPSVLDRTHIVPFTLQSGETVDRDMAAFLALDLVRDDTAVGGFVVEHFHQNELVQHLVSNDPRYDLAKHAADALETRIYETRAGIGGALWKLRELVETLDDAFAWQRTAAQSIFLDLEQMLRQQRAAAPIAAGSDNAAANPLVAEELTRVAAIPDGDEFHCELITALGDAFATTEQSDVSNLAQNPDMVRALAGLLRLFRLAPHTAAHSPIIAAEREICTIYAQLAHARQQMQARGEKEQDEQFAAQYDRIDALGKLIADTPATTAAEHAARLRLALDAETGISESYLSDGDVVAMTGALAFLEAMSGGRPAYARPLLELVEDGEMGRAPAIAAE